MHQEANSSRMAGVWQVCMPERRLCPQAKQGQEPAGQQRATPGSGSNSHKRPRSAHSPGPVIQDVGYGGGGGVQVTISTALM